MVMMMIIARMVVLNFAITWILKRSHASWNQNSGFQYLPLFSPAVLLPKSRPAYLRNIWISRFQWFSVGSQCSFIERKDSLWESSCLGLPASPRSPPPKVCPGCQMARFGGRRFVHFLTAQKERNLGDSWGDDYRKWSTFFFMYMTLPLLACTQMILPCFHIFPFQWERFVTAGPGMGWCTQWHSWNSSWSCPVMSSHGSRETRSPSLFYSNGPHRRETGFPAERLLFRVFHI